MQLDHITIRTRDLPRRFSEGLPMADFDDSTLFGGTAKGYSDYTEWAAAS